MSDLLRSTIKWPETDYAAVTLPRTGARPLVGRVRRIGHGYATGTGTTVHVHILRRAVGGYVVYYENLTVWQGSHDQFSAALVPDPAAVLAELGGDDMRRAEQDAWEQAARNDPAIAAVNAVEI